MYQSVKRDLRAFLGFGLFYLALAMFFGNRESLLFNLLFLSVCLMVYFLCLFFISHKKTRIIVCSIGMFLAGFPIFYVSQQYEVEEPVQATPASSTKKEESIYQQVTSKMKTVTPEDFLFVLAEEETIVLYVGRETCPYCTSFIHKMQSVDVSSVYYMDTEEKTEVLRSFAQKYELDAVPQLLRFQHQELVDRFPIDEDVQPEEIAAFVHG